jgi:nicotinate-nucleotide pyrophosphorylase (carboxylating)
MSFPNLDTRLKMALQEDRAFHDLTSLRLPDVKRSKTTACFVVKEKGVFCGGFLIGQVLKKMDSTAKIKLLRKDGDKVAKGTVVAKVKANSLALLGTERVILNLLTHLSGVATITRQFRDSLKDVSISILDTRKTTPLWRDLEKYAVRCGGGVNHRFSLEDAILVKDNHIAYLRRHGKDPSQVYSDKNVGGMRKKLKFIAMEATNYREVWEAIKARAEIILLDNMPGNQIKGAMVFIKAARKALGTKTPWAEVSGGVSLKNIRKYANLGIDRISIGALTHSAPALDISLEVD